MRVEDGNLLKRVTAWESKKSLKLVIRLRDINKVQISS